MVPQQEVVPQRVAALHAHVQVVGGAGLTRGAPVGERELRGDLIEKIDFVPMEDYFTEIGKRMVPRLRDSRILASSCHGAGRVSRNQGSIL